MARVTVEDCLKHISDRFELAILAAHRARQYAGHVDMNPADRGHGRAVAALREIARGDVDVDELRDSLIRSHQLELSEALPDVAETGEDILLLHLIEARARERNQENERDENDRSIIDGAPRY